ncbi:cobalamin biosynthesis protein CobQ [Rhodobacterales bacterium HKCCE4037]|nr:cobalamin biosynthesis protein CobQ [Rhodobacterales bacterium HKCCE4037]
MFDATLHSATARHKEVYSFYEKLYTGVDTLAALSFVVGSALFFSEALATEATWCFLVGSLFFAAKPIARFAREYHLARLPLPGDDTQDDSE